MDDLISRQEAIDELKAMYRAAEKWGEETFDDTIKIRSESCMASLVEMKLRIEKLPSAQPEQQWMPCSKELPKTDKWRTEFNVTTETGVVRSMDWENTIVRGEPVSRWIWQGRISPWEVVAWMPLPEPYKGADDD